MVYLSKESLTHCHYRNLLGTFYLIKTARCKNFATKVLTHKIGYGYIASFKTKKSERAKPATTVFSFHTKDS